ncbi:MAG: hypothetical protein GF350_10910 [Chitinivibrionales bacterium]|nr:hypothetical protein [Chitinivibrionales bacterium]
MKSLQKTGTLPFLIWAGLILIVSSIPGQQMPEMTSFWQWDKIAHFAEYCILGLLLMRRIFLVNPDATARTIALWICAALVFALIDEMHQLVIPNRMCTWQDYSANSLGVLAGFGVHHLFHEKSKR